MTPPAARPAAAETVSVHVLLFAELRERLGVSELDVQLAAGSTGQSLVDRLVAEHPALAPYRPVLRIAVNRTHRPIDVPLHEGDEVALLTPMSGG